MAAILVLQNELNENEYSRLANLERHSLPQVPGENLRTAACGLGKEVSFWHPQPYRRRLRGVRGAEPPPRFFRGLLNTK